MVPLPGKLLVIVHDLKERALKAKAIVTNIGSAIQMS